MDGLETSILNHLPVGVWVARAPSGEVVYTNDAFAEIMGMSAVANVGIEGAPATYGIFDRSGHPYPFEKLPFSRVLATQGPVVADDLVIHRRDHTHVHVRATGAPVRGDSGQIEHVIVAFFDITTEAEAVDQGRELQQQLAFALNNSPMILFAVDRAGVIRLAEGAALTRIGAKPGELVGRPALQLYRGQITPEDLLVRALRGEVVRNTADINGVILDVYLNPIRDARGQLDGVIGVCTDVTEQRQMQARLIESDRVMAMGTLAASVAHEINNPLTYIMGNLDHIEGELDALEGSGGRAASAAGRIRQMIAEMREGAERVQQVARDLRSFARPEADAVGAVDVHAVIRSVLQLVRKEIEARARLEVSLHDTPPVRANEARLVQVVLNLLVNAWQALPDPDPRKHRVGLRAYADGKAVIIEVSDSGTGVADSVRPRMFEPFVTTKEIGRGAGLGLFVCRNLVTAYGGDITVDSPPGGGAVFRVMLPAAERTEMRSSREGTPREGDEARVRSSRPRHDAGAARRARVLIIDDDELVAGVLVNSLKAEFDAMAIHDARRALAVVLEDESLDLVYCDLMMKDLTGMDIHEQVSQRAPHQLSKLVFMTGGAFTQRAASFVEKVGAGAVVYKPFSILAETRRRLDARNAAERQALG